MPYPILNPAAGPHAAFRDKVALAVMAKAPRPGKVKTRLQPPLTAQEAAALNVCFLRDTTENIDAVAQQGGAQGLICYTPVGDEAMFEGLLPGSSALVAQRGDAFGERLLLAAQDILACGFAGVCLIDSDSPTVPGAALREAVEALLRPGDRVVLGGSADGGYYLIGMKAGHPEPFENITWSTPSVYDETVRQVRGAGLELVDLPTWYDVDEAVTLTALEDELLEGRRPGFVSADGYDARHTRRFLEERRAGSSGVAEATEPELA